MSNAVYFIPIWKSHSVKSWSIHKSESQDSLSPRFLHNSKPGALWRSWAGFFRGRESTVPCREGSIWGAEGESRIYLWSSSAAQKIKMLSETPATVPIVAKLCMFDSKNRKIAEKLVQPVTPHLGCFQWGLQWRNSWKWVFGHFMSWEHVRVV